MRERIGDVHALSAGSTFVVGRSLSLSPQTIKCHMRSGCRRLKVFFKGSVVSGDDRVGELLPSAAYPLSRMANRGHGAEQGARGLVSSSAIARVCMYVCVGVSRDIMTSLCFESRRDAPGHPPYRARSAKASPYVCCAVVSYHR